MQSDGAFSAKNRVLIFSVFASAIFGWGISYAFRTPEISSKECYVYKVANTPVTAFVLKPPELTIPDPPSCPAAPKCEEKFEENKEQNAEQENPKPRKQRHRKRVRARWGR